jgi:cellobiose-specific phosphotransferase system component IIA
VDADRAVQLLQEAQLFIDAAHECHNKLGAAAQSGLKIPGVAQPVA